jgi:hypothetical protein
LRKSSAPVFLTGVEEEILNIGKVPCFDPAIFGKTKLLKNLNQIIIFAGP